jgi:chromosome segregation ATPase
LAAEEKTMDEYMQWCDDTQTELSYGIKSATAKIEDLTATITDNTAQIAALDDELEELGNEIASRTSEMEEAIAIRTKEHEIFLKSEEEQVATVEELDSMGVALKKQIAAFTATPPPVAEEGEEGAALVQKASASPAASFDAFLQIDTKKKSADEEAAAQKAKLVNLQKALTIMVDTFWMDPGSKKKTCISGTEQRFCSGRTSSRR